MSGLPSGPETAEPKDLGRGLEFPVQQTTDFHFLRAELPFFWGLQSQLAALNPPRSGALAGRYKPLNFCGLAPIAQLVEQLICNQ